MKKVNVIAAGLSIAGGIIFGALTGVAKLVEDGAWEDFKTMAKEMRSKNNKEETDEES